MKAKCKIYLKKVKGHSGNKGNDGADREANMGALKPHPDDIDLNAGKLLHCAGAAVNGLTQAQAYTLIREYKPQPERPRTKRRVDKIREAVESVTGTRQKAETLWKSLCQRKKTTITQEFSAWAWKAIHEGHKVGGFWRHTTVRDEFMPCHKCDEPIESLEHILTECKVSGQKNGVENGQGNVEKYRNRVAKDVPRPNPGSNNRCKWRIGNTK